LDRWAGCTRQCVLQRWLWRGLLYHCALLCQLDIDVALCIRMPVVSKIQLCVQAVIIVVLTTVYWSTYVLYVSVVNRSEWIVIRVVVLFQEEIRWHVPVCICTVTCIISCTLIIIIRICSENDMQTQSLDHSSVCDVRTWVGWIGCVHCPRQRIYIII